MTKTIFLLVALCVSLTAMAQTASSTPSGGMDKHHSKKSKDEVTVRGCLSRAQTDYTLIQAEQGNSYQIEKNTKMRLSQYLGKEVEVTGIETPSMSTSSDFLARTGSASSVTIRVTAIKTIANRCSYQ